MIASVRGTVLEISGSAVVVEVGGVGLEVIVTPAHALRLRVGGQATLRTALIVREDDLSLYGFENAEERRVFDLLRGVSGVGPKSALGVLAAMSPADIASAVAAENDSAFRRVSGIGPKTAKLIVLSLTGKMQGISLRPAAPDGTAAISGSVVVALVGLGWSERAAAQAVDDAIAAAGNTGKDSGGGSDALTVSALLRSALSRLGGTASGGAHPHSAEAEDAPISEAIR